LAQEVLELQLRLLAQTAVHQFMEWLWLVVVLAPKMEQVVVEVVEQQLLQVVHHQQFLIQVHPLIQAVILVMLLDKMLLEFHRVLEMDNQA
jgi:uncharacterized membrane protein